MRKELKLLGLKNEIETSKFPKISLQIECAVLEEQDVFVADSLFLRQNWEGHSWETTT